MAATYCHPDPKEEGWRSCCSRRQHQKTHCGRATLATFCLAQKPSPPRQTRSYRCCQIGLPTCNSHRATRQISDNHSSRSGCRCRHSDTTCRLHPMWTTRQYIANTARCRYWAAQTEKQTSAQPSRRIRQFHLHHFGFRNNRQNPATKCWWAAGHTPVRRWFCYTRQYGHWCFEHIGSCPRRPPYRAGSNH